MSSLYANLESFSPGQQVLTGFGPGTISAINRIDSIIYVKLSEEPAGLYLFRPEQVEAMGGSVTEIDR